MRIRRLLMRGLLKRCPHCGAGALFRRWFTLAERCPGCGLRFEREEGYWTGAMAINLVTTELLFAALFVVVVIMTVPYIPVVPVVLAGVALNTLFPLFFYPFSKTLWMALDFVLHPPDAKEAHQVRGA